MTDDMRLTQLRWLMRPLDLLLNDPECEEVCVNAPGAVLYWKHGRFHRFPCDLDAQQIEDIAILAGALRRRNVNRQKPILGVDLPGGGRLQAVVEPCVDEGKPCLTIRLAGAETLPTLDWLRDTGLFANTVNRRNGLSPVDQRLVELYRAGERDPEQRVAFFKAAVRARKSFLLWGENAAGKTFLSKALAAEIDRDARLITVENLPEWRGLPHENRIALYYPKEATGADVVTATDCVEAALRMRIGWLMVQELRSGPEAWAFLRARMSGHPGITTNHGGMPALAAMLRDVPGCAAMTDADLMHRVRSLVDVCVHCERGDGFAVSDVWFAADEQMAEAA